MRRLSGWVRLWIVFAAMFWLYGAFVSFQWGTQEPCASLFGETSGPSAISHYDACREALRRGLMDENTLILRKTLQGWGVFALGALAILGLALVVKSVTVWIWRGFRPTSNGRSTP
jgi:hypothetical protein